MAWARVQSVGGVGLSVTSKSVTFTTANVSAGNKLIVAASVDSSTQSFATTNPCWDGTNAFTQIATATIASGVRVTVWALDVPAGDVGTKPTITVTASISGASLAVLAMEFSGLATGNTTAMVDGTPGTNTGTTTTIASPTYSSTAVNELLIEIIGDWGAGVTFTVPTSSTGDTNNQNTSSTGDILAAWKNSTNGAESMAYTVGGATDWGQLLVAFKLGNTAHTQSLTATLSFTGGQAKKTSRTLAGALSFAGAITKRTTRTLAGVLSFTGSQKKAVARVLPGALSFAGTVLKTTSRLLPAAALSFSGNVAKQAGKSLSGALSFTGAQGPRVITKKLGAALSFTGGQSKSITRAVTATIGFSGSLSKSTSRALSGALSFVGATTHILGKLLSGVLSFTGSQTKATAKTLPGTLSFAGSANRAVQRTLGAALSFVGSTAKSTARSLAGGLSFSGAITNARTHLANLSASLGFSGSVQKSIQRPLSASLSLSGALNRATRRVLPGAALSFAGGFAKGAGKTFPATLSFTGSQSKSIGKQLVGILSFVGGFVASKLPGLVQVINIINPPVSGSVVAVLVVQLPGGPAIFYLLSYIPDEVPIGEVATFRVQLAGSDGSRPSPDLAPVMRVLDHTGATALANTTMTLASGVYSAPWTPSIAGAYSVEIRTALSGNTIAAQIPVTVRPRYDPIALAVSDTLVSRM
jgi:hypothetical protein